MTAWMHVQRGKTMKGDIGAIAEKKRAFFLTFQKHFFMDACAASGDASDGICVQSARLFIGQASEMEPGYTVGAVIFPPPWPADGMRSYFIPCFMAYSSADDPAKQ